MYTVLSREPSLAHQSDSPDALEIVFRIPRLECHDAGTGQHHYTIALPKFAAADLRLKSADAGPLEHAVPGSGGQDVGKVKGQVYVSYAAANDESYKVAQYLVSAILRPYGASFKMLEPSDGVMNYVDYEASVKESEYFMMVMSPAYMESLEKQAGRPFMELMAATESIPAHHLMGIHPESLPWPKAPCAAQLEPPQLRKAFLGKPFVCHDNMGYLEVFEECLCRVIGVKSNSEIAQFPIAAVLEKHKLSSFTRAIVLDHGLSTPDQLVELSDEAKEQLGMSKLQQQQFTEMVDQQTLLALLQSKGLECLFKKLHEVHDVRCVGDLGKVTEAVLEGICAKENLSAKDALRGIRSLAEMDARTRAQRLHRPIIPESGQDVKHLVAILWSPNSPPLMRAAAAEHIRLKSVSAHGMEEIRQIAGLESLIKLVQEGSPAEQVAALWALRNFGLQETYRTKMGTMGAVPLVAPMLEPHAAGPEVQHAAVSLLQVLTTTDAHNVAAVTKANLLPRLVYFLFMKGQRALKLAALATLCNMTVLDENKQACGKLRAVPRLVQLLDSHHSDIAAMAVGTLANLVLMDQNRLKTWRCGGVGKLKRIADQGVPKTSAVAAATIQVLMAGPRIHPNESFVTPSGRCLSASDMRRSVQRLNAQETFLSQINLSLTNFQSASPRNVGVVAARLDGRPARLATSKAALAGAEGGVVITCADFEGRARRPATAMAAVGVRSEAPFEALTAAPPQSDRFEQAPRPKTSHGRPAVHPLLGGGCRHRLGSAVPKSDYSKFCSPFMQRLSPSQEKALVARLARVHMYPFKCPTSEGLFSASDPMPREGLS